MSSYDTIVRGGTVVDGTGGAPFVADIGISNGRIAAVGKVDGTAKEVIDATGLLVTPGFVDVHTHYDGQAIWAERILPSSQHGVTTVVMGNCGVGFAPCRSKDHDALIKVMEGVEDIPELVMTSGLTWDWETFPQYLDALDRRKRDIDVAQYLPHSPLRVFVMGERGVNREAATEEDLKKMKALMSEALDAGALGFATSRLSIHRTGEGEHIPSFEANRRELFAIGEVMAEKGRGLLQIVPNVSDDPRFPSDLDFMIEFSKKVGRPASFSLAQVNVDPEAWRAVLEKVGEANRTGAQITAQVFPRPTGLTLGLDCSINPFTFCPTYANDLAKLPIAERVKKMRDPSMKARILSETPADATIPLYGMARDFAHMFRLDSVDDYEPSPDRSVEAEARRLGVSPLAHAYDLLLEKDGYALLHVALANYTYGTLEPIRDMLRDQNTVLGLGDGGAHYGVICDASFPTYVLSHWTRDRKGGRLSVAEAIKLLAHDPAAAVGLSDRGKIAVGYKADLNVIDYDKLTLHVPHMVDDLPGGGRRLMQSADGYVATLVGGVAIQRNGASTGALPGRLVRSGSIAQPV